MGRRGGRSAGARSQGLVSRDHWLFSGMREFHATYAAPEFLAQLVRERERDTRRTRVHKTLAASDQRQPAQAVRERVEAVPWGHHVNLLSKLEDAGQRLFYLKATARFGWSRNVLLNQIKAQAYERSLD